jgi:hypothetical protein
MIDDLLSKIDDIPANGEWWCGSTQDAYHEAAMELLALGMDREKIPEFLSGLYWAAADEFGG